MSREATYMPVMKLEKTTEQEMKDASKTKSYTVVAKGRLCNSTVTTVERLTESEVEAYRAEGKRVIEN